MVQACGALTEAHEIGLIHRDIKPQNLLLCQSAGLCDVIEVVDFGLVKALTPEIGAELSVATQVVGTPLYMSPEALLTPDRVDARSDLYALGAVAYLLLTGSPVFKASTLLEACSRHVHVAPERPSQRLGKPLPAELEALVLQCLEKAPEARPESARSLRQALLACPLDDTWSERDAEAWWREHGAAVRAAAQAERAARDSGESSGRSTVAVDLRERGL